MKAYYIQLQQLFNRSLVRIDKNTYELRYVFQGTLYKMRIKPKKGPKGIIEALDENDEDITSDIVSYLGPESNFHGSKISPESLGKKRIFIFTTEGTELCFDNDENLIVD